MALGLREGVFSQYSLLGILNLLFSTAFSKSPYLNYKGYEKSMQKYTHQFRKN